MSGKEVSSTGERRGIGPEISGAEKIESLRQSMTMLAMAADMVSGCVGATATTEIAIDVVGRGKWSCTVNPEYLEKITNGDFTPSELLSNFSNFNVVESPGGTNRWELRQAVLEEFLPQGADLLFGLTPHQLEKVFYEQSDSGFLLGVWHGGENDRDVYPTTVEEQNTNFSLRIQLRNMPGWEYCLRVTTDQERQIQTPAQRGETTILISEQLVFGEVEQRGANVDFEKQAEWTKWIAETVTKIKAS